MLRLRGESVVALPHPPSANNLFVTMGRRRFKSPEYRAWLDIARPLAMCLRPPAKYPCGVTIVIAGPVNMQRDAANFEKAVTDCLVSVGALAGDSLKHVRDVHILHRPDAADSPVVLVSLEG